MADIKATSRKITQELNRLERELVPKLKSFYNQKIKNSGKSLLAIRQESGQLLPNLIRKQVESSWLFANQILEERTKLIIHTSTNDIRGIELVTDNMVNQFWTTAEKLHTRETAYKLTPKQELVKQPEFDIPVAMIGISSFFAYYAFNSAMASKADELGQNIKLRFTTRNDGTVDPQMCRPLEGKIFDIGNVPYLPPLHRHCHCHLIPILQ